MPALLITGQIGDQSYEVRCTETAMTGSPQVTHWLLDALADQPYTLDALRQLAPRLTRLFGTTLQVTEVEEETEPAAAPASEPGRPQEPAPVPESSPELDPAPELEPTTADAPLDGGPAPALDSIQGQARRRR